MAAVAMEVWIWKILVHVACFVFAWQFARLVVQTTSQREWLIYRDLVGGDCFHRAAMDVAAAVVGYYTT